MVLKTENKKASTPQIAAEDMPTLLLLFFNNLSADSDRKLGQVRHGCLKDSGMVTRRIESVRLHTIGVRLTCSEVL